MECLYGTCSENICATCALHHTGLTVKQVKKRECLKKQCHHFQKIETHAWWTQRSIMKQKRKDRKNNNIVGGLV